MKITNLVKCYENHVVINRLTLDLEKGGVYAIMGSSGCGKTTLLHILMGILEPDGGIIEKAGEKSFSAVFQENRLFDFLTAAENVAVAQKKLQKSETINQVLTEILPKTSLEQKVEEFSGGMKRRVAIGRAMLVESDVIVMDEPLTGLDEGTRDQVIRFILKHRGGRTLIFSTHQEKEVKLFGAEKIVMG